MSDTVHEKAGEHFLYGNVRIRQLQMEETKEILYLDVIYADREEQQIRYDGVFYSAFDEKSVGLRIVMSEELPLRALETQEHRDSAQKFWKSCGGMEEGFLDVMAERGNKLFVHYVGKTDEYIVIARSISVHL